jgi:hypothetical protein
MLLEHALIGPLCAIEGQLHHPPRVRPSLSIGLQDPQTHQRLDPLRPLRPYRPGLKVCCQNRLCIPWLGRPEQTLPDFQDFGWRVSALYMYARAN